MITLALSTIILLIMILIINSTASNESDKFTFFETVIAIIFGWFSVIYIITKYIIRSFIRWQIIISLN